MGKNVVCLSIDMIGSTKTGLKFSTQQRDRVNKRFVKQINPHLKKLDLTKSLVKFTGDGWLVMTSEADEVVRLCCLATIMVHRFREEISEGTGISKDEIPSLRLAIHSGLDISVELPDGRQDWVGDSARRADRASAICNPNEIIISEPVRGIVLREFQIEPVINIEERRYKFVKCKICGTEVKIEVKKWEEDIGHLFTLGDLKPGVADYIEAPKYLAYTLKEIGKEKDVETLGRQASEYLGNKSSKLDPSKIEARREILQKWNRAMAMIPNYPSVLETLKSIQTAGLAPDIFTYNILINKAPDYDEARVWMETMKEKNIQPDVVTYSTLIKKAPDYDEAKALVDTMEREGIKPNVITYSELVEKAPDYDEAKALVDIMIEREGIKPNVITYSELVEKAPDYDEAKALLDTMREEGIQPNMFTYNTLIEKAPDYDEAKALVDTMREVGVSPDAVTYNTLMYKAPDYKEATKWVYVMREEGIHPDVITYSELVEKAPDYDEAKALLDTMREEGIQPNVITYSTLIKKAPDYDEAKALVDTMGGEGIQPNVFTYSTLFNKDLSGVLADNILKWYLAQKYHPPQPIEAAIASYRKRRCLDQALRLSLGYPHMPAARKLIREHEVEALSYFKTILDRDPQHPNVDYALGITLMELGREPEAIPHLKKAQKLATADARIKDIEERLRRIE